MNTMISPTIYNQLDFADVLFFIVKKLISVMFSLIRPFDRYADVIRLLLCQLGQFDADALQVEAGNFFV